jgi:hypothetical protein
MQTTMQAREKQDQILGFCYIFPAMGMSDLSFCYFQGNSSILRFVQKETQVPFPQNGFFQIEPDITRFETNTAVFKTTPEVHTKVADMDVIRSFLSLGHVYRIFNGLRNGDQACAQRFYTNAIRLAFDESGIRILEIMERKSSKIMICSTDDDVTTLLPEEIKQVVAEVMKTKSASLFLTKI